MGLHATAARLHAGASNAGVTREHNRRVVLQVLRQRGPLSRADLTRLTGLSAQAISNITAELLEARQLKELGRRRGQRGQPPIAYAIDPSGGFTVGIEIRPRGLVAVAANLMGDELAVAEAHDGPSTPEAVAKALPALARSVVARAGRRAEALIGLGVVAPRSIGGSRTTAAPSTELPGWHEVTNQTAFLLATLAGAQELAGASIIVDNDATAAALAEQLHGAGRSMNRFACLYFGRGLGLGLVLDGRIQRGAHGFAGEIGQMPVQTGAGLEDDQRDYGGQAKRGAPITCLEHHLSMDAALRALDLTDAAALAQASGFEAWLDAATPFLGTAVTVIEALLDPERIILCGQSPALLEGLMARAARLPPRLAPGHGPRLALGAAGPLSAARGAAALPLYDRVAPEFSGRLLVSG